MVQVDIREAADRLDELADEASKGEVVILARPDGRRFRLVPDDEPRQFTYGFARGPLVMSDDFDEPLEVLSDDDGT